MKSIPVLICGESGSGKSSSVRTLDESQTFIISVSNRPLMFPNNYELFDPKEPKKGNFMYCDNANTMVKIMEFISNSRPEITKIIVDDLQYSSANEFMRRIKEKSYDKFSDIARNLWYLATEAGKLRPNIIVYFLSHDEHFTDADGVTKRKAKTLGKLINDKLTFEGMFSVVLFTEVSRDPDTKKIDYNFITQSDGSTTAKSPMGMFEYSIPNDLKLVDDTIREYYNIR
jgi:hypothetical protein